MTVYAVRSKLEIEKEAWYEDQHHLAIVLKGMDLRFSLDMTAPDGTRLLQMVQRSGDDIGVLGDTPGEWLATHLGTCLHCSALAADMEKSHALITAKQG